MEENHRSLRLRWNFADLEDLSSRQHDPQQNQGSNCRYAQQAIEVRSKAKQFVAFANDRLVCGKYEHLNTPQRVAPVLWMLWRRFSLSY